MCDFLLTNLPLINNDNWTEWSQFWSEIVLMISNKTPTPCSFDLKIMRFHLCRFTWFASVFWDKSAQANFSKANQIAWASKVNAICSLWKIWEFWFMPNFRSKIMWLLVNNIEAKICLFFPIELFFCFVPRLIGLAACCYFGARVVKLFPLKLASSRLSVTNNWPFLPFLC